MKKSLKLGFLVTGLITGVLALGINHQSQISETEDEVASTRSINYFYSADLNLRHMNNRNPEEPTAPITMTINHYVDGYTGEYYIYKQEYFFNLKEGRTFYPEEHYLNFDFNEWEPEYSHTNLETDEPFQITEDNRGMTINYYYKADLNLSIQSSGQEHPENKPVVMTLNHYVENGSAYGYHIYKQETFYHLDKSQRVFSPADHYLNFDFTEWEPEFSHTNLESDAPFYIE